ncbi:MAG: Pleckstrin homology domain-containing protein, partial [Olpidium bornovanus]
DVYTSVSRRRIEPPPWAEAALVGASPTSLVRAAATVRSLNALRSQSPGGGPSSSAGVVNSPLDGQSPGTVHDHPSPGVYSTLSPTSRASLSSSLGALFAFGLRHSASTSTVGSFATVATGDVFDKESLGNAAETSTAGNVKEGLLIRKHLLERTNKQATSRSWKKSRAVLQNAELMLYNDSVSGRSEICRPLGDKHPKPRPDLTLCLLHAVATALPGVYSHDRKREHVFAINLFNGGAYLLQAPTAAECADWIAKANLEAARRSREPLGQGVTNFDFGWGRVLERLREEEAEGDADGRPPARPFSEKDYDIREWKAPEPNVEAVSGLSEVGVVAEPCRRSRRNALAHQFARSKRRFFPDQGAQLESLTKRLGTLEEEIEKHHRLREKMQRAVRARVCPVFFRAAIVSRTCSDSAADPEPLQRR